MYQQIVGEENEEIELEPEKPTTTVMVTDGKTIKIVNIVKEEYACLSSLTIKKTSKRSKIFEEERIFKARDASQSPIDSR